MRSRDYLASRVSGRGDAKQDLLRAGVSLLEPALQRIGGGFVTTFDGFEDSDAGRHGWFGGALMQGKTPGDQPLPEGERQTQDSEDGKNCVGKFHQDHRETVHPAQTVAGASTGLASMRSSRTSTPCGGMS